MSRQAFDFARELVAAFPIPMRGNEDARLTGNGADDERFQSP